jgi:predicted DNA-binding transcriptional regulator YafY
MSRKDRLFEIMQLLRTGDVLRACDLARTLEVSVRTIYRDMDTLAESGVPIEGTQGTGYHMTSAIALPPITLSPEELEALHLGITVLTQAADPALKAAAESLAAKIDASLPTRSMADADAWKFNVHPFADTARGVSHMPVVRAAIKAKQKLRLTYHSRDDRVRSRVVRPLLMEHFGRVWTLTAWCELRTAFRAFRLDLIESAEPLPELFVDEVGKRLDDKAP